MHTLLRTVYALYCTRYAYIIANTVRHAMYTVLYSQLRTLCACYSKYCIKFPCVYYAHTIAYGMCTVLHTICVFYTQFPYV